MSLAAESPSLSSSSSGSSDDFAAFLESELDFASPETSPEGEHADEALETELEDRRTRKRKVAELESMEEPLRIMKGKAIQQGIGTSVEVRKAICPPHPGFYGGLCMRCGQPVEDDGSGIAFGYIHKDLILGASEIERLREDNSKRLLHERKLMLVLDLDHTLINSTLLQDVTSEEEYLLRRVDSTKDDPNRDIFRLDSMHILTKLRPFVQTFLREASSLFEMYVFTMGEELYALEMTKLLDPRSLYFNSKVLSKSDSMHHQKGLEKVLGNERIVVILDDTDNVWKSQKENLILMERYHYFASSCRQLNFPGESYSVAMKDEREPDGVLARILNVLKRTHAMFFDLAHGADLSSRDVRQVIDAVS